jgi:orotidine-5'-phosphate decarboxylase
MVEELGRGGVGERGISDVGAVIGATAPGHLPRARELMAHATFLLPGVGAQGGRVEDLAAAFAPGRAGGLVSASRSIADAHRSGGAEPRGAARAEAERLREAAWKLSDRARVEA